MVLTMFLMLLSIFLLREETLTNEMQSERHGWAMSIRTTRCEAGNMLCNVLVSQCMLETCMLKSATPSRSWRQLMHNL